MSKLSEGITIPFLRSHPSSKDRIQKLSQLSGQLASKKKPEPIELERNPFVQMGLLRPGMVTSTVEHLMVNPFIRHSQGVKASGTTVKKVLG